MQTKKAGTELITDERARQISEEGHWSRDDDQYLDNHLVFGAMAYLDFYNGSSRNVAVGAWAWDESSFKPDSKDEIRNLVKAGAMIAAEIDRRHRAEEAKARAATPAEPWMGQTQAV